MNVKSIGQTTQQGNSLRRAMRSNGIFSGLSGLVFLVAAKPLATFTGFTTPAVFTVIGAVLIAYDFLLFWAAAQEPIDRRLGYAAVVMDIGWVVGSIIILLVGWPPLTVAGKWMVVLLAEVVAAFAIWQAYALRKLNGEPN